MPIINTSQLSWVERGEDVVFTHKRTFEQTAAQTLNSDSSHILSQHESFLNSTHTVTLCSFTDTFGKCRNAKSRWYFACHKHSLDECEQPFMRIINLNLQCIWLWLVRYWFVCYAFTYCVLCCMYVLCVCLCCVVCVVCCCIVCWFVFYLFRRDVLYWALSWVFDVLMDCVCLCMYVCIYIYRYMCVCMCIFHHHFHYN